MRVVLAVDQSKYSETAIHLLATQKFKLPVDLEIISVIAPLPYIDLSSAAASDYGLHPEIGGVMEDERECLEKKLAALATKLESRFQSINCRVVIGPAAAEIKRLANETNADLIVMGALGHSAIARVLLGSVSDYVATQANASTLVVRPKTDTDPETPIQFERILLSVGTTSEDKQLIDRLGMFDLPRSTEIHLLHVMQMMKFYRQDLRQRTSKFWQQSRTAALQNLLALEKELKQSGFSTQTHILEEPHIGEALVNYASRQKCDLILARDQHPSILGRAILGSTSRYVLRHADCSVMIVRAASEEDSDRFRSKTAGRSG